MDTSHTQLKALVLMLVLVLGFTVFERSDEIVAYINNDQNTAGIFNPVAAFLGIPVGNNNSSQNYESLQTYDPLGSSQDGDAYFNDTPDDPFGTGTLVNTPAPTGANDNSLYGRVASTDSGSDVDFNKRAPTLLCLPGVVDEGEEAIVMWGCRDGAYKAVSDAISTSDETIGLVRVQPGADTTYELECVNNIEGVDNTAASCVIEVARPALAVIATPSNVTRGRTISISWKTKDTNSCVVTSNIHPSFQRQGIEGDALSPVLTRNTIFTLTCETITGVIEERHVSVGVN